MFIKIGGKQVEKQVEIDEKRRIDENRLKIRRKQRNG